MKPKSHLPLLLASLLVGVTPALAATLVMSENYDSYTPGVLPGAGGNDNGTDLFTRVEVDSGNLFGGGTSNQYLRIADTSNTNSANTYGLVLSTATLGQVGTISLNFYDPAVSGEQGTGGWLLRWGTGNGNSVTAFGLFINNGTLRIATGGGVNPSTSAFATYSLDTLHSLKIVFNSSASSIDDAGHTLEAGRMDVWLNGSIAGSSLTGAGTLAGGVNEIANVNITRKVSTDSAVDFVGTLNIDDWALYSGVVAIPEPSAATILSGGLILGFCLLHRRRGQ